MTAMSSFVHVLLVVAAWISSPLAAAGQQDPQQANVAQLIHDLQTKYESKLDAYESRLADYDAKMLKYEARLEAYEIKVKELEGKLADHQQFDHKIGHASGLPENTGEGNTYEEAGDIVLHRKPGAHQETAKKDSRRFMLDEGERPVAFYAQLTKDVAGIGNFQTIVFNLVTTNAGNAYNVHDGVFTAPVSGIYVFIWTASNNDNTHMQTELVKNAIVEGRQWSDSGNHADISSATGSAVLSLNATDTVWVRSNTIHSHIIMGQDLTSFSGWLLYPAL